MTINNSAELQTLLAQFGSVDHKVAVRFSRGDPPRQGYRYSVDAVEFERGFGGTPLIVLIASIETT